MRQLPHGTGSGRVSRLLHGKTLAALALSLTIGYVGQVISNGSSYTNLEGPVFGTRVGVYHVDSLDEKLDLMQTAHPASDFRPDGPEHHSISDYKVVLYKLPNGSVEHSTADDFPLDPRFEMVCTLPGAVRKQIAKQIAPAKASIYPILEEIPEDSPLPGVSEDRHFGEEVLQRSWSCIYIFITNK